MKLLFTSFQTWLPHQKSNSSDDILAILQQENNLINSSYFLRQLPVETEAASKKAIAIIDKFQPQGIICCGMAESRQKLTIESCATREQSCLHTLVSLDELITNLKHTSISHDAGKFVCEGLYYRILEYLQLSNLSTPCIFVHVPVLTQSNQDILLKDFRAIIVYLMNNGQSIIVH